VGVRQVLLFLPSAASGMSAATVRLPIKICKQFEIIWLELKRSSSYDLPSFPKPQNNDEGDPP
jgi:hypothetical protein